MNEKNKEVRKNSHQNEFPSKLGQALGSGIDQGILETGAELKRALDAWNELAGQAPTPAADEKLIQDVQILLKQLKSKIEEFK